jgi:MFS family permease
VLALASLGWVVDVFEGQIFIASMTEAMPALLPPGTPSEEVAFYTNLTLAAFLVGGALGGVLFGMLGDWIGRTRTMTYTILMYSVFTGVSALAQNWWQIAALRFLVAVGVGGEWAVASTLVAEVFPQKARARSQSIFHASSVLGTYLAIAAGRFVVAHERLTVPLVERDVPGWRVAFALGVVPALLIIWIRTSLHEPQRWLQTRAAGRDAGLARAGNVAALFTSALRSRTLVGVGLAAVGLATFWGTHVFGKDVLVRAGKAARLISEGTAAGDKSVEMLGMFLVTTGGGVGLLAFGPISERFGRRGAFLLFQLGGLASALALFLLPWGVLAAGLFLPVFGFLTLGMHAGYAVYFPELFPTHLRGTGAGFCFNVGRFVASPILVLSGWLQHQQHSSREEAAALLSLLFAVGIGLLLLAPETKGQDLPE